MSNMSGTTQHIARQRPTSLYSYLLLWVQWVSASVVAGFAGLIAGFILFAGVVTLMLVLNLPDTVTRPVQIMSSSLVIGGLIGLSLVGAQKLLIERYVQLPRGFIRSSTIGALLGLLLNRFNEIGLHLVAPPIVAAAGGAIFGFSQWLVLRRSLRQAGWWVPANMLAWGSGGTLMYSLVEAWTYRGGSDPFPGDGIFLDTFGLPMVCLVTASAITGIALVWLLRTSSRPSAT